MTHIQILQPGTFSQWVSSTETGLRRYGIPVGGPADAISYAFANALVGNPSEAEVLEVALSGPRLLFEADHMVAWVGAEAKIECEGQVIPGNATQFVRAGQSLNIGRLRNGFRGYLAVAAREGSPNQVLRKSLNPEWLGHLSNSVLRVLPGPQAAWFEEMAIEQQFEVTANINRMGVRLEGPKLFRAPGELVSEAISPGAIQVTNEGQCIIIGVDGQTIGGYPKIAHVIAADLPKIGQLPPGQKIRFQCVRLEEAEVFWDEEEMQLRKRVLRIRFG
ncbi:biotin-dependent carboxyltransferase family protein [Telmatocola sphagniphila]|uniref:Biotin-dependent carboxyltransferase family protein n=1 Tax=Telmatocola sphagniphila TaxID=1123043 RepID=A0A8E6B976_9BACT|nr:biotin-dependent carboxyltransferase family protein [Telmatocola sphagniphila]QVL33707.1 biotin-dependent carboxyltransferase family protein [Telmatocola sphagniphila]